MADFLFYDVETRSREDLKKVGTYRYAANPFTEVLCAAMALDDDPIEQWTPGKKKGMPAKFEKHIRKGGLIVAHGVQFERAIHRFKLSPVHGWPEAELKQFRCSQAMASALSLPPALENISDALGIEEFKDKVGKRVMLQMTKPRKARKGEDPDQIYWHEDAEKFETLGSYCAKDVSVMRQGFNVMWPLTDQEQSIFEMDQIINDRGFYVDPELLRAMRRIITDAAVDIDASLVKITDGAVKTVGQVAEIKTWLFKKFQLDVGSLDKKSIPLLLADAKVPQLAKDVLELRLAGAQAAVKKVDAFLARRDNDGRVRGSFLYHSAGTGRWASRGAQVHNLKRLTSEDQDEITDAVKDLMTGDYKILKAKYARPLKIVGDNIRTVICAAPGKVLIGADFSGIEARVTAWVAGELRKIKIFQAYDAGTGPDPYVATGADIFGISIDEMLRLKKDDPQQYKVKRQGGKGGELAFGFQGGVNAYVKFVPEGLFTLEEIDTFKVKWRKAHPNTVELWAGLNRAATKIARNAAIIKRGRYNVEIESIEVNNLQFHYVPDNGGFMFMELPSGRSIAYPGIGRVMRYKERYYIQNAEGHEDAPKGQMDTFFMDNSGGRWHRVFLYGGIICENAIQGIARDLLAAAMLRIEAAGYPIVAHVHDEAVIEVPKKGAEKVMKEFVRLMCILPDWAVTPHCPLPVVANGWMAERYVK